ncbi:OmpA family protein [Flavobacterium cheniae]|jgi:outer membrane protein OmpA-like peptidoglycan-associated protein|uniref:Outer membrane protein OmpA-like peptidoglycan-associated protein n=1 Tax=Flavobacterium cheniae TaxID=295428 RepID=A0A562KJT5_9FLAO|nr:OmpA family protein [Flavobacterium cheniae]TDR26036.1 outer membrane protein OmpA-like peptidoglycan-associated protein [Flavobacterium cheniae]TWH95642.1 outer membrane protein OmpA-like peptidoglycan-associated protein [Flavobacterium cheniae]
MKFLYSVILFVLFQLTFAQEQVVFYFDNNKFELNKVEAAKLQKWISENTTSKILSITGSTDEVGSTGFNDTLSQKRVSHVFNQIKGKINIRPDFKSISLGEKGATSTSKAENRKAIIHYLLEKDLDKEDEVLGIKEVEPEVIIPDDAPLAEKVKLAKVGTKITLKNINFYQNTFATMPESQGTLYDLLFVMQNNPELIIEIQGHICCIDKDYRNLSTDRAKQIKRFLVYNGIQEYRVKTKGFGVSQPIHPIPEATPEQAAANRRVEIEILSKKR